MLSVEVSSVRIFRWNYLRHLQRPVSVFLFYEHCKRPEGMDFMVPVAASQQVSV